MATVFLVELDGSQSKVKKSSADLMVRRLLAKRIAARFYKRIAVQPARHVSQRFALPSKPYIPDTLPSPELPGIKFKETQAIKVMRLQSQVIALRRI